MFKMNNKGFSLVELIVVIVILGVLVAIAVPNVIGYVERSRISTDLANANSIISAANLAWLKNPSDTLLGPGNTDALEAAVKAELQGEWPVPKAGIAAGEPFIIEGTGDATDPTRVTFAVTVNSIKVAPTPDGEYAK